MTMSTKGLLEDKLALVTGAASGIGREICQVFSREGAKLAAVDINLEGAEETVKLCGDGHSAFKADVSNAGEISDMFGEVVDTFGKPPSVVINCAGIAISQTMLELTEENLDKVMSVNVKGVFLVTQQAAKLMISHQIKGTFVNISSSVAKQIFPGLANYGASKAAVCSLTRSTATELAPHGIRCNIVLPGAIQTPFVGDAGKEKEVAEMVETTVPLRRIGQPEEIADVCLFLASDKSSYMTGASVDVNGGVLM